MSSSSEEAVRSPRISRIETFSTGDVAIVRVEAEDGAHGFGQVAPYHADLTALVLHRLVAPHALGHASDDIEALAALVPEREHKFPGSHLFRALGGVETALWDMRGRRRGLSVCELLGGKPRPFPVYASSMRRDIAPADEADRLARLQQEQGFSCLHRHGRKAMVMLQ